MKPESSGRGRTAARVDRLTRLLAIPLAVVVLCPTQAVGQVPPNSADRLLFWVSCHVVSALTDAQLDEWRDRGVDGFVCSHQHLRDMGGTQNFTGDPNHPLSTPDYELQRTIRDSMIVDQAHARGMKLYLSVYLVNCYNNATPLKETGSTMRGGVRRCCQSWATGPVRRSF